MGEFHLIFIKNSILKKNLFMEKDKIILKNASKLDLYKQLQNYSQTQSYETFVVVSYYCFVQCKYYWQSSIPTLLI